MASISVSAAATLLAAGVTAYSQHEQGVQVANADKARARQAGLQATQQQINMRQNMLRALASQNAGTLGAIGTGAASSFGANARRQINQEQNDLAVSNANASAQVSLLDTAAGNAAGAGNIGAAGDLVGGVAKAAAIKAK